MNWITVLLILFFIGETAAFVYLIYRVWKEFSFTLKDASRLQQPIESLAQEARGLQPLVEFFSIHINYLMNEVQITVQILRETSQQVKILAGAVETFRSPNVKLAIRYGRDWIEDRRANPIMRMLKRVTRKLKKRFGKFGL